ncbi:hypothetical protein GOODEAATRI_009485 [Goodea atripinnis]|uniref:Uncharacterized protein n=1 Tax=Goodea atripinnis TaxID=208336 RepID=A0ABV0MJ89_9TELE
MALNPSSPCSRQVGPDATKSSCALSIPPSPGILIAVSLGPTGLLWVVTLALRLSCWLPFMVLIRCSVQTVSDHPRMENPLPDLLLHRFLLFS